MPRQVAINTFHKGLSSDSEPSYQPEGTIRDLQNGKIVYNEDGSYTFENIKGTKLRVSLAGSVGKAIPIGFAELPDKLVVFLARIPNIPGSQDIIVYLDAPDYSNVVQVKAGNFGFDSQNAEHKVRAIAIKEGIDIERVYWTDRLNEPGVINVKDPAPEINNLKLQPNWTPGYIHFLNHIAGNLLSGAYRYSHRMKTKDGYVTPWSILTMPVNVTTMAKDEFNWTKYFMDASGKESSYGVKLRIEDVDTRFDFIEVAYIYYKTEGTADHASVFTFASVTSATMEFNHGSTKGMAVNTDEFAQVFRSIKTANTIFTKDNLLLLGGIKEHTIDPDIDFDASVVTVNPIIRNIVSDRSIFDNAPLGTNNFTIPPNPPFTHGNRQATWILGKTKYIISTGLAGVQRIRNTEMKDDYTTYKSSNMVYDFVGYFRGETERFGILFFDKKGNPSFVRHLFDIDLPVFKNSNMIYKVRKIDNNGIVTETAFDVPVREVLDTGVQQPAGQNNVALTRDNGVDAFNIRSFDLRIMGLSIGGILLPQALRDKISGFAIVKAEKKGGFIAQGIMTGLFRQQGGGADFNRVMMSFYQQDEGGVTVNNPDFNLVGDIFGTDTLAIDRFAYNSGWFAFHSPEFLFGKQSLQENISLRHDGLVMGIESTNGNWESERFLSIFKSFFELIKHGSDKSFPFLATYMKQYHHILHTTGPVLLGQVLSVDKMIGIGTSKIQGFNPDISSDYFEPNYFTRLESFQEFNTNNSFNADAYQLVINAIYNSTTIKDKYNPVTQNFGGVLLRIPGAFPGHIRNFRGVFFVGSPSGSVEHARQSQNPLVTLFTPSRFSLTSAELNKELYQPTGHYQPITTELNNDIATIGFHPLNNIEVYGGDCYISFFSFAKHVPFIFCSEDLKGGKGMAHIFPVQSKINMDMRSGETFDNSGFRDIDSLCGTDITSGGQAGGLFHGGGTTGLSAGKTKQEKFDINIVTFFKEMIRSYSGKNFFFKIKGDFPSQWIRSEVKFYRSLTDSFRQFLANSFLDIDGSLGAIQHGRVLGLYGYSFQEDGIGRLQINIRAFIQAQDGVQVQTGTGGILTGIDYVTSEYGCQDDRSVASSASAMYFFDRKRGKVISFGEGGFRIISEETGMNRIFTGFTDANKEVKWIESAYDKHTGEYVLLILLQKDVFPFAISPQIFIYSEAAKAFNGRVEIPSNILATHGDNVFAPANGVLSGNVLSTFNLWSLFDGERNSIFEDLKQTSMKFVINKDALVEKTWDNIRMGVSPEAGAMITEIVLKTDTQTQILSPVTYPYFRVYEDFIRFALREMNKERLRGRWLEVEIKVNNTTDNKLFRAIGARTYYRYSYRI